MPSRSLPLRLGAVVVALLMGVNGAVAVHGAAADDHTVAKPGKDPRKSRGLFVDTLMPAANQELVYRSRIGRYAHAL